MDKISIIFKNAIDALDDANFNFDNERYKVSINRSYYAVFYAAMALLLKKGKNPKTHSGTISEFGLEYTINDNFDRKIGKILSELEDDRTNTDYDHFFESTEEIAKNDLDNAELFIEECKKFL